jgi:hypothetical protein
MSEDRAVPGSIGYACKDIFPKAAVTRYTDYILLSTIIKNT